MNSVSVNGISLNSPELSVITCGYPTSLSAPFLIQSTTSSLLLGWTPPLSDGGCKIESYKILEEQPYGSNSFVEVNITNDPILYKKPEITQYLVTSFPSGFTAGQQFRFKVVAFNKVRSLSSPISIPFPLISIPGQPASAPAADTINTNSNQISVIYSAVANNGGSYIHSIL